MSRYGSLKKFVLAVAVFGIVSLAAGTAKADIVVITGVNNQGTDNVLLNPATNVSTVTVQLVKTIYWSTLNLRVVVDY